MIKRRWLWLMLFSIAGYALTFLLFPKLMPAARWRYQFDRQTSIAQARQIARSLGVEKIESNDEIATVKIYYEPKTEYYFSSQPSSVGQGLFTPLRTVVQLLDSRTNRKVRVEMNSEGKLVLLEVSAQSKNEKKDDKAENDGDAGKNDEDKNHLAIQSENSAKVVSESDKQLAESAFKSVWGEKLFAASSLSESSLTKQGARLIWKASDDLLKLTARALVTDGKIATLALERDFTPQLNTAFEARRGQAFRVFSGADVAVILLSVLLVAAFYFIGLALKRIQHRQGLLFLGLTFLLVSTICTLSSFNDDFRQDINFNGNYWVTTIVPWLLLGLMMLGTAGSLYFYWAAGQALAIRLPQRRTISIELILKGKILTRPVAKSFAVGLLAGGIAVVIPFLVAASKLFSGMTLDPAGLEDRFIARSPAFSSFTDSTQYLFFIIFGFLVPLISAFASRRMVERTLIFVVAAMGCLGTAFVSSSVWGLLLSGILGAFVFATVYFRAGLLAVLVSQTGMYAALGAATLLAQPVASLQSAGWRVLAGLIILTVISLIGVWKFREVAEEETAIPSYLLETRIERERLRAEFNVAQRAQQQMLPDFPPQVPGLDIAAVCKPSKEVGGDLYDFLPLSDGKLGIVVADVSGKGVPAALYMTLTKGLLASVAETASDPGEILREVNRHLYEVCRRKMFVTLFLGVIDPATKRLVYARAGHNPTVFRRASQQQTSLLKSKGMGLGLNNGKIFNQSLQVATLQLESNDKLFFYSDGITEAMNSKNEEYGEERLMEIAAAVDGSGAVESRDAVLADVTKFLGANQPQDDQTLVIVKII